MFRFDNDTSISTNRDGSYHVIVGDGWDVFGVPNGGYLLSILLAAFARSLPNPDPLAITGHYLSRTEHGPATVEVEVLKVGRRLATAVAALRQGEHERLRAIATYGDMTSMQGPTHITASPPRLPPPHQLKASPSNLAVPFTERFEYRGGEEIARLAGGQPSDRAEVSAWIRFSDGRPPDLGSLAIFADALPPAVYGLGLVGWTPTLELTVHFRAHPAPGFLAGAFRTTALRDGLGEEDGELWDEGGNLVALSRQLIMVLVG